MQIAEAFAAALGSLPEAIRARLDEGETLDWDSLESDRTSRALGEAVRDRDRLPGSVETLVQRLVREVGIVPEDIVLGIERQSAASAWIDWVSVEPDGETYRIRNDRSGEVHLGIPAETVAGYAILAMELATVVHRAQERWLDIGDRYREAPADALCPLARCSVRMSDGLLSPSGTEPARSTTTDLARVLETAWNGQELPQRAELAGAVPSSAGQVVRAPRRRRLAPMTGYRLHACDPEEVLWLCALAERAGLGALGGDAGKPPQAEVAAPIAAGEAERDEPPGDLEAAAEPMGTEPAREASLWPRNRIGARDGDPAESERANEPGAPGIGTAREADRPARPADEAPIGRGNGAGGREGDPTDRERANEPEPPGFGTTSENDRVARSEEESVLLDMQALEERIGAETDRRLHLGTDPDTKRLDRQFDELESVARQLPGPVRQRMTACYGLNAMQALIRLQDPRECDALKAEVEAADAGGRAPRWLEELAATLLLDAGAQTRDGRRTAGLRLDATEEPDARYLVTELGTGAHGSLSLAGLIEQMHLNLAFAQIAWKALTVLRNAGKEGGWALLEGANRNVEFSSQEGETLEAAQQIGVVLDRFLDARSDPGGSPSSLQQAAMAADALAEVGPTVRAAAGWPSAPPDSGLPRDVAAMVDMAEALQGDVRATSNRLIAGQMAGFKQGREIHGV